MIRPRLVGLRGRLLIKLTAKKQAPEDCRGSLVSAAGERNPTGNQFAHCPPLFVSERQTLLPLRSCANHLEDDNDYRFRTRSQSVCHHRVLLLSGYIPSIQQYPFSEEDERLYGPRLRVSRLHAAGLDQERMR